MPLRGDYWNKFTAHAAWTMAQAQAAKLEARKAAIERSFVKALRLIGFADWMIECRDAFLATRDAYQAFSWVVPQPGGDYRDRRNQMCSIAVAIATNIFERGPYTPARSGDVSPVTEFWNAGEPTPAIYLAGRFEAATKWYNSVLVPGYGWSRGGDPAAVPDPARIVPFWGDVAGTAYPRVC